MDIENTKADLGNHEVAIAAILHWIYKKEGFLYGQNIDGLKAWYDQEVLRSFEELGNSAPSANLE